MALLLLALGWVIYVNDFRFVTEPVTVTAGGNRLTGTLVLPQHAPVKPGVVVFVHGDGPANASRDEGYYGIWEAMAQQGYAVYPSISRALAAPAATGCIRPWRIARGKPPISSTGPGGTGASMRAAWGCGAPARGG
ncbi:hypothetical protein M8494_18155 [Serratia ureilytica]